MTYRARCDVSPPLSAFSLAGYFAYVFYLPTQLAGPILPYTAFYSQIVAPQTTHSASAAVQYAAWLALCLIIMEVLSHAAPAMAVVGSGGNHTISPPPNSISRDVSERLPVVVLIAAYAGFDPLQLMMFCFVLLKLMWLKFLIIWRFFRLWALM